MPPSVSADHGPRPLRRTSADGNARAGGSSSTIPCLIVRAMRARLEHSDLFKVDVADDRPVTTERVKGRRIGERGRAAWPDIEKTFGPGRAGRNPTTSFLTATTLIYAIGAGITAGAGTRLVLRSILVRAFASRSFRMPDPVKEAPPRYFSSLPPSCS